MNNLVLVERHYYKPSHPFYKELDHLSFLSKNLYNSALYAIRQHYFKNREYLNYYAINREFIDNSQIDYISLPRKVSNQILKLVDKNMVSFFKLLKLKKSGKYDRKVKLPKYLDKIKGRQIVHYEKGAISFKRAGFIKLSQTNIFIPTKLNKEDIEFTRVVHKDSYIVVEIGYKVNCKEYVDNERYASIDLGLHNLIAMSSPNIPNMLISGKPLISINQYFNKELAKKRSELKRVNNTYNSKKINRLFKKRDNKINDYMHKASRDIVNHLVSNNINTLFIGKNREWKQDINLGAKNNQKFVSIPYNSLIEKIEYKAKIEGIKVILVNESYTSLCSFLDGEDIKKHSEYKGNRVKRGLYKTSKGKYINADINASYNILRKGLNVAWNENIFFDCVEVCSMPYLRKVKTYT